MRVTPSSLVKRFYHELWNRADEDVAREILHPDLRFRASLGPERRHPDGFIAYLRSVHNALGDFTCTIDNIVAAKDCAAARMTFKGTHRAKFFGIEATGREITWAGGAFFKIEDNKIKDIWVLGDIDAVKQQLDAPTGADFSADEGTL
jgi:steroid delta-isomerase-like uncharacterized protein